MLLHLLATIGNFSLLVILIYRKGWRTWRWIWWAQIISIILLIAHNYQLYFDHTAYIHWWYSFDVANDAVEIAYLFDLQKRSKLGFSVIAGLCATTKVEYMAFEAGHGPMANQMTHVRQWVDCVAMYLLCWIIFSRGGNTEMTNEHEHKPIDPTEPIEPEVEAEADADDDGGDGTPPPGHP